MHHCCLLEAPKHAKELGQSSHSTLAVYMCKEGALRYPTNAELSKQIKGMTTAVHMHLTPVELVLFSWHFLQERAAVLLRKAGKDRDS
jgi:hypothetical protein